MNIFQKTVSLAAVAAFGCTLALPLISISTARADDTTYSWSLLRKKGEISRYRQRVVVTGSLPDGTNLDVHLKSVSKQEVKEVADSGDALVVETVESRSITVNGNAIPDDPTTYTTIKRTFSKSGLVLKSAVENATPGSETLTQMSSMLGATPVPDKAVKIGDSWTTEIDNSVLPGKKSKLYSTAEAVEKVAGIDTIRIKVKLSFPIKADSAEADYVKVEGSYNIDPKTGKMLRASYAVDNTLIPSPVGELKAKTSSLIELIVAGVNDKDDDAKPAEKAK